MATTSGSWQTCRWTADVRAAQLRVPRVRRWSAGRRAHGGRPRTDGEPAPFLNGLGQDREAVLAGLALPYGNGPTEGVNTKTKLIARQMYGRAGFPIPRHRILLA